MEKTHWSPSAHTDHANLASEWYYTVEPKLRELQVQHPEIKIHLSDCTSQGRLEDNEDTSALVDFRSSYFYLSRRRYICDYQHSLLDQGIASAIVTGIEKPSLTIKNNNFYATFFDEPIKFKTDVTADRHSIVEFFYWTPDSPYMVVNQVHEIIRYLQRNFAEFKRIEDHLRTNSKLLDRAHNLDNAINASCYPVWKKAFQTNKTQYAFEHQQFHSLLVPFLRTEKFAQVFHHRYYADAELIRPDLIFRTESEGSGKKNQVKHYPVMSLQKFYQDLQQNS
jgi:hypothetical protein